MNKTTRWCRLSGESLPRKPLAFRSPQKVELTATEYELLCELSVNGGRVWTYDQLLRRVWGLTNSSDVRVIRSLVRKLRRKLDDDADSPPISLPSFASATRCRKDRNWDRRRASRGSLASYQRLYVARTNANVANPVPPQPPTELDGLQAVSGAPARFG